MPQAQTEPIACKDEAVGSWERLQAAGDALLQGVLDEVPGGVLSALMDDLAMKLDVFRAELRRLRRFL